MKPMFDIKIWTIVLCALLAHPLLRAQEPPPKPIAVFVEPGQGLIFGAIFLGPAGGTVTIYPDGTRTVMGTVVGANLGYPFSPAIFEVEANRGTLIHILRGPDVVLTGNNGGTMTMKIGDFSTSETFITTATPPTRNLVKVGGILTVGSPPANPVGDYSGTFNLTFIQE